MNPPNDDRKRDIRSYVIGYVVALTLTAAAFAAVRCPSFPARTTLAIVFSLALVQLVVHFRYFLHISLRRSSRDDLLLLLFSTLIITLMVSGTIVLLLNLRHRMM